MAKLVEILARDLEAWPEGARFVLFDGASGAYADMGIGYRDLPGIDAADCDIDPHIAGVTREQWQAARDALNKPAIDWSKAPEGATHAALTGGVDGHHVWYKIADRGFHFMYSDELRYGWLAGVSNPLHRPLQERPIRPIRTPEQIEAEERKKAIEILASELAGHWSEEAKAPHREIAAYLFDQGYRKQEPK